jgi:Flp pilus assembly protein TadB
MNDPYRVSPAPEHRRDRGLLRPVLWLLLVVSAAANAVASASGLTPLVGVAFGVVTLACVAALIVHHYRNRR